MADISKVDKNFEVKADIGKDDVEFFSVDELPFKIYGVFKENGKYRRMPESVAKTVSEGVYALHANTAGGRVKFVTDSPYVAIYAKLGAVGKMPHFPLTGSAGFDLYADNTYVKTFIPPFDIEHEFQSVIDIGETNRREIDLNFPLYSELEEVYVGLAKGSFLGEASAYTNEKPVVYYGSSITQGGCASRPGMSYQAIVSRKFNIDYVNLGFSGNAKAEDEIIDYIKNLDMSMFVYDYDHNAPSVEHLFNTHEKMFKAIREVHPEMPVIIMSRPKYYLNDEEIKRREIIETTYNNAVSSGDKNVYFIDGRALTALCLDSGTVDNCHPTDFGFVSMAKAVCDVFEKIIE